jgi:hypothetical protein
MWLLQKFTVEIIIINHIIIFAGNVQNDNGPMSVTRFNQ